jgi:hypothetical protein
MLSLHKYTLPLLTLVIACAFGSPFVLAQSSDLAAPSEPVVNDESASTVFNHSAASRFWVSGQLNVILQWHPSFKAKYDGPNSLRAEGENATSRVLTLYTGAQLTKTTEVFCDIESAGGRGISDALGLAGFTNLDVVRNPTLGAKPYLARLMLRQIIPLSSATVETERGAHALATKLPAKRLEVRFGKFSTADFFDVNSVGSDSHLQFMNWTVDNNGGYDYAADTRGYTYGAMVEYQSPRYAVRFGEMLMPKVANGLKLDWNLRRARAENVELELRHILFGEHSGTLRLLSYVNHANMGSYREALNAFLQRREAVPDIEAHRQQGRVKYGFGVNLEQELNTAVRLFGRWGWNEGRHESFAYTEINNTVAVGVDVKGAYWQRKQDKLGLAFVSNGISGDHRRYLALGGRGFLLGDGALSYGRERIFESYYNLHLWRGVFAALDFQHVNNPGYNRDRGPVLVPGLRLHLDL